MKIAIFQTSGAQLNMPGEYQVDCDHQPIDPDEDEYATFQADFIGTFDDLPALLDKFAPNRLIISKGSGAVDYYIEVYDEYRE